MALYYSDIIKQITQLLEVPKVQLTTIIKVWMLSKDRNNNWNDFILSNNSPTVSQWQVYKYIKEQIPEIK